MLLIIPQLIIINAIITLQRAQLEPITCLDEMKQLILEPTHILQQSYTCIDLIFNNKLNIVMDSGVELSLRTKCQHQIIYSKLNLKIEYLLSYNRKF